MLPVKTQRLVAMLNRVCRAASFDILRSVSDIEVPLMDLLEDSGLTAYLAIRGGFVSITDGPYLLKRWKCTEMQKYISANALAEMLKCSLWSLYSQATAKRLLGSSR